MIHRLHIVHVHVYKCIMYVPPRLASLKNYVLAEEVVYSSYPSLLLSSCLQYLSDTADNLDGLHFKLHDFGFRGSTSVEVRINLLNAVVHDLCDPTACTLHAWQRLMSLCM